MEQPSTPKKSNAQVDLKYFFARGKVRILRMEIEYVTVEMRGRGDDRLYSAKVDLTGQKVPVKFDGEDALAFARWYGFPVA